jgi:hypothetical protein
MGVKHNCVSIGFNPLELGKGVPLFIGEDKFNKTNDIAHMRCHTSFGMHVDWISDEEGSMMARLAVEKSYIRQQYDMGNKIGIMMLLS